MPAAPTRRFWDLAEADLAALTEGDGPAGEIPASARAAVIENLTILLGHARIMAAAVPVDTDLDAPAAAFAP